MPPRSVTSTDLIAQARSGSADALSHLFTQHAPAVYRVALRLTASIHDAEDIVQDVFLGLPHALRGYQEHGTFDAWLKRIAVRYALMSKRGADRREAREISAAPDDASNAPDIPTQLTLERAIAQLPVSLRTVFVLHDVEGYSNQEIASLLSIRAGTAQVRLFRARAHLRAALEQSV